MNKIFPFAGKFLILLLIMLVGTVGFILLEHYTVIDALYMTTITLATIGYNEVEPLSDAGKIFNIIFIISSFAVFAFIISSLTRDIVSGEMARHLKNRKFMNAISKFSGHVIICGFGRHGQKAAEILSANKMDYVVIDKEDVHMKTWLDEDKKLVYIHGDATDDETIIKAGIMKAKAVLLTMPADADNVFTVLSIRAMNPGIIIISRAQLKSSVGKLKTAGADHVILPELIGGAYMASLVSSPDVIELINSLWGDQPDSAHIESVAYENLPTGLKDKSIEEIVHYVNTGVNCLGIKDKEGRYIVNPPQDTIIAAEMKIIFFGSLQQISGLKGVVGGL
jgi:voltage-gated potassium channel